jgi:hypothetical protein
MLRSMNINPHARLLGSHTGHIYEYGIETKSILRAAGLADRPSSLVKRVGFSSNGCVPNRREIHTPGFQGLFGLNQPLEFYLGFFLHTPERYNCFLQNTNPSPCSNVFVVSQRSALYVYDTSTGAPPAVIKVLI